MKRTELAPQLKGTLNRLPQQVARATPEVLATKQWRIECTPEIAAQHFWGDHDGCGTERIANGATGLGAGVDALNLVELILSTIGSES